MAIWFERMGNGHMEWTVRTRDELLTLFATQPESTADAVIALQSAYLALAQRLPDLERQVHQTSQNSHQPPSKDNVFDPPAPKSLRPKSTRPTGGQLGHPGAQLEMRDTPDAVALHRPPHCQHCGTTFPEAVEPTAYDRRQVFDLKIGVVVTEHRAMTVRCVACGKDTTAEFPEAVSAPVQYGPGVYTFLSYGNVYQLLPADRLCEMFEDLTGHAISQGTLFRTTKRLSEQLRDYEEAVKQELLAAPVVHFDESGVRVEKKLHWLHVASTGQATYYRIHSKRGAEAMDAMAILPQYTGIAEHDGWASYGKYHLCKHGLCNQHHERELQGIIDHDHQPWAQDLINHLHTIKTARETAIAAGRDALTEVQLTTFAARYREIVDTGLAENPRRTAPDGVKVKGKVKQTKARNLLERLDRYQSDTLRFMYDFRVPYTNNQAEQDVRMIKVHQKISGDFRSVEGADIFCRIRGYISTLKKRGLSVWENLRRAHEGKPFMPTSNTS